MKLFVSSFIVLTCHVIEQLPDDLGNTRGDIFEQFNSFLSRFPWRISIAKKIGMKVCYVFLRCLKNIIESLKNLNQMF